METREHSYYFMKNCHTTRIFALLGTGGYQNLTSTDVLVLLAISYYWQADSHKTLKPTIETLQRMTLLARSAVWESLQRLVSCGLLEVVRAVKRRTVEYRLNPILYPPMERAEFGEHLASKPRFNGHKRLQNKRDDVSPAKHGVSPAEHRVSPAGYRKETKEQKETSRKVQTNLEHQKTQNPEETHLAGKERPRSRVPRSPIREEVSSEIQTRWVAPLPEDVTGLPNTNIIHHDDRYDSPSRLLERLKAADKAQVARECGTRV